MEGNGDGRERRAGFLEDWGSVCGCEGGCVEAQVDARNVRRKQEGCPAAFPASWGTLCAGVKACRAGSRTRSDWHQDTRSRKRSPRGRAPGAKDALGARESIMIECKALGGPGPKLKC